MRKPGSAVEATPINERGQPCAADEPGKLRFRKVAGPAFELEYYKNQAASHERCAAAGFAPATSCTMTATVGFSSTIAWAAVFAGMATSSTRLWSRRSSAGPVSFRMSVSME